MDVPASEILLGVADDGPVTLRLDRANRHGLVAGATGTGKTVTLQRLAEAFSAAGVPVFAADVKGDLSGVSAAATPSEKLLARAAEMGVTIRPAAAPVILWDLFGEAGHPVRATVSELGPVLLARLLDLSDVQTGVLNVVFHVCDKEGLLLLDMDDLQAALAYVSENSKTIGAQYGAVAPASIAAIQRGLLQMRGEGAEHLFGEPALKLRDLMRTDTSGRGFVSLLSAEKLIAKPGLYAVFLLWLMSELFEELPELGDPDKPKLVFFFDEAHLLFRDAPKPLLEKVEQVVRLIRSKGVGIYFVTQNPQDVPESVLAQLGMRVQHALRAYTPSEQKALKAAANSFRANPVFETVAAIQDLGVGEALVSALDARGAPTIVRRTRVAPPDSRIGPITPEERARVLGGSPVAGLYDETINRESAFELLKLKAEQQAEAANAPPVIHPPAPRPQYDDEPEAARPRAAPRGRAGIGETLAKSVARTAGSSLTRAVITGAMGGGRRGSGGGIAGSLMNTIGRELVRGVFGNLSRGR